jgi:hypothetical protein
VDPKEEVRQLFVRNGKYGVGMKSEKGKSRHGSSSNDEVVGAQKVN